MWQLNETNEIQSTSGVTNLRKFLLASNLRKYKRCQQRCSFTVTDNKLVADRLTLHLERG